MILPPDTVVAERYRLVRPVARGGSSEVWLAEHVVTKRPFALKVLAKSGSAWTTRFVREARIAAELRHPNVVPIHDVFALDGGTPVLVMDWLEGDSLATRLRQRGPMEASEVVTLALAIASALVAAHALGVVHRDLKPDNVFVTPSGIKVLDFGIARWRPHGDAPAMSLTETGALLGTPHYMAPEQIFGEADVDARADIWALGVVLYECLTGKKPFDGDNAGQVFKAITTGSAPPIAAPAPSALATLVGTMLARKRDDRPTLDMVRAQLEAESGTSGASGVGVARSVHPPPPATRRSRTAIVAATMIAIALATAGAVSIRRVAPPTAAATRPPPPVDPAPPPSVSAPTTPAMPSAIDSSVPLARLPMPPPPSATSSAASPPPGAASVRRAPRTDPVLPGGVQRSSPY